MIILILTGFIAAIGYASYTGEVYRHSESGFKAPVFTVSHPDDTISIHSLKDLRGHYVLLSFWSSADPVSRLRVKQYDTMAKALPDKADSLIVLGVNFDRTRRLFDEIVKLDSLDIMHQLHASGNDARRLMAEYRMKDGYQSFLISPDGSVLVDNPSIPAILSAITNPH